MEEQGFTIEAAAARSHRRPGRIRLRLRRARLRPDVVARDRRRAILGFALDEELMREPYVPAELDAYAATCRLLVICVAQETANQAIHYLFEKPVPNWRKMRLLKCPGTELEDVSRAANQKKLRELVRARRHAPVHVLPDEE